MHAVMLVPGWPGTFHRTVRDAKGEVLKVLEFHKDLPQELSEAEFAAVKNDIGLSLCLAEVEHGKPVAKVAADQKVAKAAAPHKETAAEKRAADKEEHGRK